jgi:hypothetical protein
MPEHSAGNELFEQLKQGDHVVFDRDTRLARDAAASSHNATIDDYPIGGNDHGKFRRQVERAKG